MIKDAFNKIDFCLQFGINGLVGVFIGLYYEFKKEKKKKRKERKKGYKDSERKARK